ncbi:hypothetical protein D3C87_77130 [compost metagenome]
MWPFKKKKIEVIEVIEVDKDYKSTTIKIFENEENPWRIVKENDIYVKGEKTLLTIKVFRLDLSKWEDLYYSTQKIIGVATEEYSRIIQDLFPQDLHMVNNRPYFKNIEAAQKVIDEFAPCYDTYHTTRAIMDRLMCYEEGGYPPYFIKYQK